MTFSPTASLVALIPISIAITIVSCMGIGVNGIIVGLLTLLSGMVGIAIMIKINNKRAETPDSAASNPPDGGA